MNKTAYARNISVRNRVAHPLARDHVALTAAPRPGPESAGGWTSTTGAGPHEALECYGPPEIFNSDQGSQFTSVDFTDVLNQCVAEVREGLFGVGRGRLLVFGVSIRPPSRFIGSRHEPREGLSP